MKHLALVGSLIIGLAAAPTVLAKKKSVEEIKKANAKAKAELQVGVLKQQFFMLGASAAAIKAGNKLKSPFAQTGILFDDYTSAEKRSSAPAGYVSFVNRIKRISKKSDLAALTGTFNATMIPAPLNTSRDRKSKHILIRANAPQLAPTGKKLPKKVRRAFSSYYKDLLAMSGAGLSKKEINDSLKLQLEWIEINSKKTKNRITKPQTLSSLKKLVPQFDWKKFSRKIGVIKSSDKIRLINPERFAALLKLRDKYSLAAMKGMYVFHLTSSYADILSKKFQQRSAKFANALNPRKELPIGLRAVSYVQRLQPEALSAAYAMAFYWGDIKQETEEIASKAKKELVASLQKSKLDSKTKKLLIKKAKATNFVAGHRGKVDYKRIKLKKGRPVDNINTVLRAAFKEKMKAQPRTPDTFVSWATKGIYETKTNSIFVSSALLQRKELLDGKPMARSKYFAEITNLVKMSLAKSLSAKTGVLKKAEYKRVLKNKKLVSKTLTAYLGKKTTWNGSQGNMPNYHLKTCLTAGCKLTGVSH